MGGEGVQPMLQKGDPMSFHRRDFLTGTAAIAAGMTAALVGAERVDAGDASLMNNGPLTRPFDFSKANLKVGSSLSDRGGAGTWFMKSASPAPPRPAPPSAAVIPP